MANVAVRLDAADLAKLSKRISDLLHDTLNLGSVMDEAAEYMKRSTVNRVLRTKIAPNGDRWEALSEVTVELKGHEERRYDARPKGIEHGVVRGRQTWLERKQATESTLGWYGALRALTLLR